MSNEQDWQREFREFASLRPIEPTQDTSRAILHDVRRRLHPSFSRVATKLGAAHGLGALVTLSVCPQFGVGPFLARHGLMAFFMGFGHVACAMLCGAFFLGTSLTIASLLLSPEEWREARRRGTTHLTWLAAISLGALMLAGGSPELLEALFWTGGGLAGGLAALRLFPPGWARHGSGLSR